MEFNSAWAFSCTFISADAGWIGVVCRCLTLCTCLYRRKKMNVIDGDSHFMEPLDLFERHIDPAYRERAVRIADDPISGERAMLCDNRPMKLRDVDEVLGLLSGYGQKEAGRDASNFDRYSAYAKQWQDMDARVRFMD